MNWLAIATMIGGAVVGYAAGATRANLANERGIEELQRWIDKQAPGPKPPLGGD